MLLIRRIIAVFLALVLVMVFVPALVVFRVNSTAGNPNFYINELRRADVYRFLSTEVLPAALGVTDLGTSSWAKPYIQDIAMQVLPPDWLQAQTEQAIRAVMSYVIGDAPGFVVTIPLKSRVEASTQAVKDTLRKPEVFNRSYDQLTASLADTVSANTKGTIPLTSGDARSLVRSAFPADWVLKQLDGAIDAFVPYITGDRNSFTIQVTLADRADALKTAFIDILKKPEVYDYIVGEAVVKSLKQQSGALPAGITLTDSEILSVAKQVVPLDWYQAQVPGIVGQIFDYLTGLLPNLQVTVSMADRGPVITGALVKLLDQKLEAVVNSLPTCTTQQLASMLLNPPTTGLPPCRPLGMSYADLKGLLGIDFSRLAAQSAGTALASQITITDATLGDAAVLSQARQWFTTGFTYTDAQLKATMGATTLDSVRQLIAFGYTFTDKDMRNALGTGQQEFDGIRTGIGTARHLLWVLWLLLVLLVAGIGFLGGRQWSTRLIWAGAALAATSVIAVVIFGPVFSATAQPAISDALSQVTDQPDKLQALLAGKGVEIARNAVNTFIGGLRNESVVLLLLGVGMVVGGSVWYMRRRGREAQG